MIKYVFFSPVKLLGQAIECSPRSQIYCTCKQMHAARYKRSIGFCDALLSFAIELLIQVEVSKLVCIIYNKRSENIRSKIYM